MEASPEVTAEWTVTAKLRLIRPGDNVRAKSVPYAGREEPVNDTGASKIYVYKWTSDNPNQPITDSFDSSHQVRKSFTLCC